MLPCQYEAQVPKDDLVGAVCGYYSDDSNVAARYPYHKGVPDAEVSRIRRRAFRIMRDISILFDLIHETLSDAPPFVCVDTSDTLPRYRRDSQRGTSSARLSPSMRRTPGECEGRF